MAKKKSKHYLGSETLSQRQWLALAWLLFKTTDKLDWAFVCPRCQRTWTIREFRDSGQDPDLAYQQCIDRAKMLERDVPDLPKGRCDWAAFGLFGGPWAVQVDDRERPDGIRNVQVFPFVGSTHDLVERARRETEALYAEAKAHQEREGR